MVVSLNFTEDSIQPFSSGESFHRGREYYEDGAVLTVSCRGEDLFAEVQGSEHRPYQVHISLRSGVFQDAGCSCPYDWGGICKHVVAALLECIHHQDRIQEHPSIEDVIDGLDRDQLKILIVKLAQRQPDLADQIEFIAQDLAGTLEEASNRPTINPNAVRRRVSGILYGAGHSHSSRDYWSTGDVIAGLVEMLEDVSGALYQGDGQNSLVILEALTQEYVSGWYDLDDSDGELSGFFEDLSLAWAEALLTVPLSRDQRQAWVDKLTAWAGEVDQYGLEDVFEIPQTAALQGWDNPHLRRVLNGEVGPQVVQEVEYSYYLDELARVRLKVLERQDRTQEYLYLAEAEGQTDSYMAMLVKLGRVAEAVAYGLDHLHDAEEAMSLAMRLWGANETESALRVARHGLTLEGRKSSLDRWLRQAADAVGQPSQALSAAIIAFRESLQLADYKEVKSRAESQWPQVKDSLLGLLANSGRGSERIKIYLHENMVVEAVQAVEEDPYVGYDVLAEVVEAAGELYPDWCIDHCRREADYIMDTGRSKYYSHAVKWLSKARVIYLACGREAEWQSHQQQLVERHRRKRSLAPYLVEMA